MQASTQVNSGSPQTDRISTPGDLSPTDLIVWRDNIIKNITTIADEALGHYAKSSDQAVRHAACSELVRRIPMPSCDGGVDAYKPEAKPMQNTPPSDLWPPVYLEFSMSKNAYLLRLPGNITRSVELPGDLNSKLNALRIAAVAAAKG